MLMTGAILSEVPRMQLKVWDDRKGKRSTLESVQ